MRVRKAAVGLALLALIATGVLFGAVSSGSAASPAVTFTLSCPSVLTPGTEWGCTGTIENLGPQTATHVRLVQQIPGATLLDSSFDEGTCEDLVSGGATCALGNFGNGDAVQFTTIFETTTTAISNTASVSFDEQASDQDVGKQDTVCANNDPAQSPCNPLTAQVVPVTELDDQAGGQVAFEGDDTLATTGTLSTAGQVLTKLEIPFRANFPLGVGATIFEAVDPAGEQCPDNVTCFGQSVEESLAGQFLTTDPVEAEFRIVAPKGKNEKNIVVYHDGDEADSCDVTPLSATVDTCVDSRSRNPKTKVVTIVVLSTDNGWWDFG